MAPLRTAQLSDGKERLERLVWLLRLGERVRSGLVPSGTVPVE
jgi:hypothetical protein